MSKSDEIRREQELAQEVRPIIVEGLRRGEEPVRIAEKLTTGFPVDSKKAYRWVVYVAEQFEARRARLGLLGLLLLWPGTIVLVLGILLWVPGLIVGLPLAAAGSYILARRDRLVRMDS
jgi:hypothetical protein